MDRNFAARVGARRRFSGHANAHRHRDLRPVRPSPRGRAGALVADGGAGDQRPPRRAGPPRSAAQRAVGGQHARAGARAFTASGLPNTHVRTRTTPRPTPDDRGSGDPPQTGRLQWSLDDTKADLPSREPSRVPCTRGIRFGGDPRRMPLGLHLLLDPGRRDGCRSRRHRSRSPPGTYNETQVLIDKPLTVQGAGPDQSIIDGGDATGLPTAGLVRVETLGRRRDRRRLHDPQRR